MAPTNPIGRDPATGKLMEFISSGGGGLGTFDGGSATSSFVGGPILDCGHAT